MSNYLHGYIRRSGFLQGMGLLAVIVLGLGIWGWFMAIKLTNVHVSGALDASEEEIREQAGLVPGETLFDIDPSELAQKIESLPWISIASISRYPNGTLQISVTERIPVVLVMNPGGLPVFYLDREGHRLPVNTKRAHDVPVLHGYPDGYALTGETENKAVTEFLVAIGDDFTGTSDMISEVSVDAGQIDLRLEPAGKHGAIPVQLGSSSFAEKLNQLQAFWNQGMLPRQGKHFEWIDLRYDSQIVVRESSP